MGPLLRKTLTLAAGQGSLGAGPPPSFLFWLGDDAEAGVQHPERPAFPSPAQGGTQTVVYFLVSRCEPGYKGCVRFLRVGAVLPGAALSLAACLSLHHPRVLRKLYQSTRLCCCCLAPGSC